MSDGTDPGELLDRLERLSRLRETGALDEAEYQRAKARLLPPAPVAASPVRPEEAPLADPPRGGGVPVWLWWTVGAVLLVAMVVAGAVLIGRDAVGDGNRTGTAAIVPTAQDDVPSVEPSAEPLPEPTSTPDPVAASSPPVTVDGGVLLIDGQPTRPAVHGNSGLAIVGTYHAGDRVLYLVEDEGGIACPATYHVADVSADDRRVSPPFGTCAELTRARLRGDALVVTMSGYKGPGEPDDERDAAAAAAERHVFRYRDGQVREQATAPPPSEDPSTDPAN